MEDYKNDMSSQVYFTTEIIFLYLLAFSVFSISTFKNIVVHIAYIVPKIKFEKDFESAVFAKDKSINLIWEILNLHLLGEHS